MSLLMFPVELGGIVVVQELDEKLNYWLKNMLPFGKEFIASVLRRLGINYTAIKKSKYVDVRARNLWYFGSKFYHVFSFATGILMW